uniref:Uncharacterized protein n=1 Tax=Rhizophora mucronata TaxID=61149 RepID=A0A2P2NAZ9_RHIMU
MYTKDADMLVRLWYILLGGTFRPQCLN